jgi:hypothetical protein
VRRITRTSKVKAEGYQKPSEQLAAFVGEATAKMPEE